MSKDSSSSSLSHHSSKNLSHSSSSSNTNNSGGNSSGTVSSKDENSSRDDVYDEQMTENPNAYYCALINKWLDQYTTTVHRRVSSITDCSPSLFIILYESISKDNPNTNPKQYPKFIRDKTLTISQNQYNLVELITYLKEKYKHSFILRNIEIHKLIDREPYEIIKFLDWFIQLEKKRVHAYIPQLDDPSFQSQETPKDETFSIKHRKKMLKIQRDKLEEEHNSFIHKTMINAQAKEESLMRQYLSHSNRIEKENLVLSVNSLKKKERDMQCKLQDRKDSISNL